MSVLHKYCQLGHENQKYLIFLSYFWLCGYSMAIWRRLGLNADIVNIVVLVVLSIICNGKRLQRIHFLDFLFYVFLVCMYLLSASFYPRTSGEVYAKALEVLCGTVPFFFIGIIIKFKEYSYWIVLLSRFAIILNIVYVVLLPSTETDVEEQMHKAYILLPSLFYILWQFIEHFKLIDFLFCFLGFLLISSMGSRGPLACIIFFVATYLFFFKEYKHKIFLRSIIVCVSLFLYLVSDYFALFMILLLSSFGKSSRTFEMMLDNSFLNYEISNGRDEIHEILFRKMRIENADFGFGLFSDRLATDGFYSHNIFIELWFSFGYVIGSVLVGAFLLLFCTFLYKIKETSFKVIALIYFSTSFIKLNFSGSFIFDAYLFFLIGYCLNGLRESKSINKLTGSKAI